MTIQDNLINAGLIGVITTTGKTVSSAALNEHEVLYGNDGTSFVVFNGSKHTRKFRVDFSAILSPGANATVTLNFPKLSSPFTYISESCNEARTIAISKTIHITLNSGASLSFQMHNSKSNIEDGFIAQLREMHEKRVCGDCKEMFGIPDKYVKAYIVLMLIAILVVLIFEFFTLEKDETH